MSKYSELVDLLEESGVLQLDEPWAKDVQDLIKKHKVKPKICLHTYHLGECTECGIISPTE